jgi:hypothetical protein
MFNYLMKKLNKITTRHRTKVHNGALSELNNAVSVSGTKVAIFTTFQPSGTASDVH